MPSPVQQLFYLTSVQQCIAARLKSPAGALQCDGQEPLIVTNRVKQAGACPKENRPGHSSSRGPSEGLAGAPLRPIQEGAAILRPELPRWEQASNSGDSGRGSLSWRCG
ncbi:hypothetical protein NDU88_004989 [Pleurodeles waltl]|uniref:Uncharacterized protein n=1 Tax=Pleurodeles waltl TaxID=8319 RepID=A0AAV7M923_PLEWA|nr:hypothetical protein NDU88_004989 [Pleurodeles waltl]